MQSRLINVFDRKINCYIHGQGRPFLLIHGHRADALRCRRAILFFAQKFKVYAPDLPGFGRSPDFDENYSMENYARYLNELVRVLRLKDYLLFGVSMGGVIVLKMMLQKPKNPPKKLILVGTPYDKKYWRLSFFKKIFLAQAEKLRFLIPLFEAFIKNDFLLSSSLCLSFPPKDRKKTIIEYEMKQWRVMPMKVWYETMLNVTKVDFSQEKEQIKIPALIVNAHTDQYFDIKKTLLGLKRLCPNHQVLFLPFSTHVPKGELKVKHLQDFQPLLEKI